MYCDVAESIHVQVYCDVTNTHFSLLFRVVFGVFEPLGKEKKVVTAIERGNNGPGVRVETGHEALMMLS